MVVLHLSLGPLNIDLHAPLGQVYIGSMQYVLVALQNEEASSYSILLKCNCCTFTLWMTTALDARGRRSVCSALHATVVDVKLFDSERRIKYCSIRSCL